MKIKGPVWSLGAMSGTSLDGVDAAMVLTDGIEIKSFGDSRYRPYSDAERAVLRKALGKWDDVAEAAEVVETAHAELLSRFEGAQVAGFHGQTLAHRPWEGKTHQAGNGQVLAEVLEIPVVWDFRANDMEMGGQGAPLAPFFHFACARRIGVTKPVAFLNIGGVANITWVDPAKDRPEAPDALLAFDTGPGNAPLNDLMETRLGRPFDEDGAVAARGFVDEGIIAQLLEESYFYRVPPKSLDRDDFATLADRVRNLSDADAAATLSAVVAATVAQGIEHCPKPPSKVFVTGGGRRNPVIMAMLEAGLGCPVVPVEEAGFDGDMFEAQAFAYLAVRVMRGLPTSAPGTTGVAAPVGGGRISYPGRLVRVPPE